MIDGSCPARPWQRRALGIGNRDQRQLRVRPVQRAEPADIQSAMERGDHGHRTTPRERKVNAVGMTMDHIERVGARERLLDEKRVQRNIRGRLAPETQGALAHGHQLGRSDGITAREQRYLMPLAHEFFRQIRDGSLRPAVELWRDTLVERCNLRDAQNGIGSRHHRIYSKAHTRGGAKSTS